MVLLPVLASEAELAAGDGGVDLRHGTCAHQGHSFASRSTDWIEVDGGVQPLRDLAVGGFQRRERAVSPSSAAASRVRSTPSACTCAPSASSLRSDFAPPLDRGIERVERQREPLHGRVDGALICAFGSLIAALRIACKNLAVGKRLGQEPYVPRDIAVNAAPGIYPDVFDGLCMARMPPGAHIDSGAAHAIHRRKQAFSMSANASSTAAAVSSGRRGQEAASSAHARMANAIRALAMDAVEKAKSGHPGMPMGMADVATVLFSRFLKFDPADPAWPDRDRFVLSAGHGSMLLYSLLYLTGYAAMTLEEIKRFRQVGSCTRRPSRIRPRRPASRPPPARSGQGIANAVGMAIAERIWPPRFGDELVDHQTYVIARDGDLMEGISHEAIALAGHLKLNKLIVLCDDNDITIDGATVACRIRPIRCKRFKAAGWTAARIDGHDPAAIAARAASRRKAPTSRC